MGAAPLLTFLKNGEVIKSCQLPPNSRPLVVGRGEDCVIRLEDRAISRRHVVFTQTPEGIQVEKKSEYAPLSINGKLCASGMLVEGDVIALGPYLVKVSIPPAEANPLRAAPAAPIAQEVPVIPIKPALVPSVPKAGPDQYEEPLSDLSDAAPATVLPINESPIEMPQGEESEPAPTPAPVHPIMSDPEKPAALPAALDDPMPLATKFMEIAESDAATKVAPIGKIAVRLIFKPGSANVEEYVFSGDEISIGRAKTCDIVLNDKRASRKNAIIRKAGLSYVIKDLASANGTFVNGVKISEQELTGEDQIQIGDVIFNFLIKSADYTRQVQSALPVESENKSYSFPVPEISSLIQSSPVPSGGESNAWDAKESRINILPGVGAGGNSASAPSPHIPGMTGVTGIAGMGGNKGKSLFAKLPARQKFLVGALGLLALWWGMEEGDAPKLQRKPQSKPSPGVLDKSSLRTFERLKPEEQKFVKAKHALAFQYYTNGDFDKALYELSQLFSLVSDYDNSIELKHYAEQGKRRSEAMEEEKKRKEEEARIKAGVAELADEVRDLMEKKQYRKASELFPGILEIDPDNAEVGAWRKEIGEWEESERIKEIQKQTRTQINKHAWGVYAEAKARFKAGKYRQAINILKELAEMGASDPKLHPARAALMRRAQAAIAAVREPFLQEAKQLEESGDLARAYQLYRKATLVDPEHPAGYLGMKRLRAVLHDRAKVIYTEAVLAESYSDFDTAKNKFKECLSVAPVDDIYYERSKRKLSRYLKKGDLE